MTEDADPLFQHIGAIRGALDSSRRVVQQEAERPVPEKRDLARSFLYGDLNEAATLIGLIYKITCAHRDLSARQRERAKTLPTGEHKERQIVPTSEEGLLWHQRIELTSELVVLTKALYEWLYHIREDIKNDPTLRNAIPPLLTARLMRYCTFRNKLITHKKGRKVYNSGGVRYMNGLSKFEILLVPVEALPDSAVKCLAALYERAKPHFKAAEILETNVVERMAILYRRLDRFPGKLQSDVKTFMEHYGTISDTPEQLAAFLDDFIKAILPHLAD